MNRAQPTCKDYRRVHPGSTIGGEVGTFSTDFVIRNRNDNTRNLRLNGTVDTGASYTVIPARLLDDLGVDRDETLTFVIADGSQQDLDVGWVEMELQGRTKNVYVVFGADGGPILLGAMALEAFALAADAKNRCLIPGELSI